MLTCGKKSEHCCIRENTFQITKCATYYASLFRILSGMQAGTALYSSPSCLFLSSKAIQTCANSNSLSLQNFGLSFMANK